MMVYCTLTNSSRANCVAGLGSVYLPQGMYQHPQEAEVGANETISMLTPSPTRTIDPVMPNQILEDAMAEFFSNDPSLATFDNLAITPPKADYANFNTFSSDFSLTDFTDF